MSKIQFLCLFLLHIVIALLLFNPVISYDMIKGIKAATGYFGYQFSVVFYPNN